MSNEPVVMGPVEPKPATATKVPVWEPQRYRNWEHRRSRLSLVAEWFDANFERLIYGLVGMAITALAILLYMLFLEPVKL